MQRLSYLHQPPLQPFRYETINSLLEKLANEEPHMEIYIHRFLDGSRKIITSKELFEKSTKLAMYLNLKGIRKGDRIGLFGPNSLEWIIGEIGIILAGAVAVHVTAGIKNAEDVLEILQISKCKGLLVHVGGNQDLLDMLRKITNPTVGKPYVDHNKVLLLSRSSLTVDYSVLEDILHVAYSENLPELFPEETIVIFSTSGSTGKPKLVPYSHANFTKLVRKYGQKRTISFNDRPFGWLGGTPFYNLITSDPRVFMDSSISHDSKNAMCIWNVIKDENCKGAFLPPYLVKDILCVLENKQPIDFKLEIAGTAGQIIDKRIIDAVGYICEKLMIGYGATEVLRVAYMEIKSPDCTYKAGDVGKLIPGAEVRIVDATSHPVKYGATGSIQVKTPNMFAGYENDALSTSEVITTDGWFKTGDVGRLTEEGHLIVEGREKDVISRGTRKILPGMIEDAILQITNVKDIVVIGVPDERLYEEVCLCYIALNEKVSQEAVISQCKERLLADDAVDGIGILPKYYLEFKEFPKLSTGKIDKKLLKKEAMARLKMILDQ